MYSRWIQDLLSPLGSIHFNRRRTFIKKLNDIHVILNCGLRFTWNEKRIQIKTIKDSTIEKKRWQTNHSATWATGLWNKRLFKKALLSSKTWLLSPFSFHYFTVSLSHKHKQTHANSLRETTHYHRVNVSTISYLLNIFWTVYFSSSYLLPIFIFSHRRYINDVFGFHFPSYRYLTISANFFLCSSCSATYWANFITAKSTIKLESVFIVCHIWPHVSHILYLGIYRILSKLVESPKKSLQSFWQFHLKDTGNLFFSAHWKIFCLCTQGNW